MGEFSPIEQTLWALSGLVTWTVVYALMIRRGILDKSFGMPVIALCANIAWECYFAFFSEAQLANKVGAGIYLVFDLGVLGTCLRFGKNDFDSPMIKKYFKGIISLACSVVFL